MIAAVDVYYPKDRAIAGAILFEHWRSEQPVVAVRESLAKAEPYEPGHFYKRELPCLIKVLERVKNQFEIVVIDGYVWLKDRDSPGLGAHLHQALGEKIPVIGVAKSKFKEARCAKSVLRGRSRRPLYVTAIGIEVTVAAKRIKNMDGRHRIPTLLKMTDMLSRDPNYLASLSQIGTTARPCEAYLMVKRI
jgi:deoxyribonuclease V